MTSFNLHYFFRGTLKGRALAHEFGGTHSVYSDHFVFLISNIVLVISVNICDMIECYTI